MDERIAERRQEVREARRRSRLRRTVVVTVLLLLVVAGVLVERSPLVALQGVEVRGNERVSEADVLAAAGLEPGTSTLRLRLEEAAARVAALPGVRTAEARRLDPLTVEIDVVERVPVIVASTSRSLTGSPAGVPLAGARLVDADGIVVAEGIEPQLPVVVVSSPTLPAPGEEVGDVPQLAAALAIHLGLPGPLRSIVERYEARGADDVDLLLETGVRVRFGPAERIDEKARSLGAVLQDLADTPISVIDVRAPSTPTVER